jgi:phosphate transport system substrate-binding protein
MMVLHRILALTALIGLALVSAVSGAEARDQIRIVGSSTVFPFSTTVAEQFGKASGFKTPVVESTGTGGGLKIFCQGVGVDQVDITNASRRIKKSEVETCAKNGVTDITEVKIGFDGIVVANSKAAKHTNLTLRQLWLALAKQVPADEKGSTFKPNPYKTWNEIDPSLPAEKIEVLGPPPTSGTRDALAELAMEGGCKTFPAIEDLKKSDETKYKEVCQSIREDGAYIEAGENDILIVQKLNANPHAYGIFGYSFLDQNRDKVQGSTVDAVDPTYENISSGKYPISRSLYFYVKNAHVGVIPGIKEYVEEFTSEKAWGPEGYLADKGLVVLPDTERKTWHDKAVAFAPLAL